MKASFVKELRQVGPEFQLVVTRCPVPWPPLDTSAEMTEITDHGGIEDELLLGRGGAVRFPRCSHRRLPGRSLRCA